MKYKSIIKILILATVIALPASLFAGVLSNAIKEWDPVGIYGTITNIDKDIITVNEKKVVLINDRIGKKIYKTSFMDINGNDMDSSALKNGKFVVVKGSGAYDPDLKADVIVAKEIYILPREMNEQEMNKYPVLSEMGGEW